MAAHLITFNKWIWKYIYIFLIGILFCSGVSSLPLEENFHPKLLRCLKILHRVPASSSCLWEWLLQDQHSWPSMCLSKGSKPQTFWIESDIQVVCFNSLSTSIFFWVDCFPPSPCIEHFSFSIKSGIFVLQFC